MARREFPKPERAERLWTAVPTGQIARWSDARSAQSTIDRGGSTLRSAIHLSFLRSRFLPGGGAAGYTDGNLGHLHRSCERGEIGRESLAGSLSGLSKEVWRALTMNSDASRHVDAQRRSFSLRFHIPDFDLPSCSGNATSVKEKHESELTP